ncbi:MULTISPECIES: sulfate permease [unclassified Microbulbifer]|uniref:SulP family inorganic anion transporter n=1 Tax=unclassified Microbulbifer TaxID=2619833 RepID=UPI0027E4B726|nr:MULTISPECIES: sulfate permease [unclassified Microbulbifer]
MRLKRLVPDWLKGYQRQWLAGDTSAALVTTMMLVPQSLAYALLAGLPPHIGLYASLLPLLGYALFGSSMVLSVGPMAVLSLMTASALTPLAAPGSPEYIAAAALLAALAGLFSFALGMLRLGILANLLSHPVITGFIAATAVLIIVGQVDTLLGVPATGVTALQLVLATLRNLPDAIPLSTWTGLAALLVLIAARLWLPLLLCRFGMGKNAAQLLASLIPMAVVLTATALVVALDLEQFLPVVGPLPPGLPQIRPPPFDWNTSYQLLLPALIIALLNFIGSLSVAQAMAAKRGERLDADAELRGLGAANIASALSGGMPVTGSLSRTVISEEAGAVSPMAGVLTALMIGLVLLFLTGIFAHLPIAVLAATIIVAAASSIDMRGFARIWRYDRADGLAMLGTFLGVMLFGIEAGIGLGVGFSFASLIWHSSRPHIAVMGRLPGTEHFRNVLRHTVETSPEILFLRIDESLFFNNISAVEDRLLSELKRHPQARELVLILSSVNRIDGTALERLQQVNRDLKDRNIRLHLSEVKGPVLDRLGRSRLLEELSGRVFLSSYIAELALRRGEASGE